VIHQGTGAGQFGVSGSVLSYQGVTIGSVTGGTSGSNLVINLTSTSATPAVVSALLKDIGYSNTSTNPSVTPRQLTFTLTDGQGVANGGLDTTTGTATVNVVAVNTAPTAAADNIITNVGLNSSVVIPEWALLANDTDPDSINLDLALGAAAVPTGTGLTVTHTDGIGNAGFVSVIDTTPANGSFSYRITDGSLLSTAVTDTVTQQTGAILTGTAGADILIARNTTANTLNGAAGNDVLVGGGLADTLNGGAGSDTLFGGAGRDTFVFGAGNAGITTAAMDKIVDFAKGAVGTGDLIDYTVALTRGGSAAAATATEASISTTTGIATFAAGSGTTLADAVADIATRFTSATNAAGEMALFKVGGAGDYYLYVSDGVAGAGANDVVIDLVGVTTLTSIDLTGGNLTILG
jgi:Ca2+-binding RTX toxin-like protein